jgi:hypothetical protein
MYLVRIRLMPPPGRLPTNARAWRCPSFAISQQLESWALSLDS